MGQIEDFQLFKLVVEHESIGKAADTLNIAKSAASRRLKLLEDRIALRLIDRSPGQWQITPSGRALYDRIVPLVDDVADISEEFTSKTNALTGKLRVSVPEAFGLTVLLPTLLEFRNTYPEINLELDFDDRIVDLTRENYDLVIRIAVAQNNMDQIAHLGITTHKIASAPQYLGTKPKVIIPADLKQHQILHYGHQTRAFWSFNKGQKCERIALRPYFTSNSAAALINAAKRGMGVVRAPDFLIRPHIQSGALVPLLSDYTSDQVDISIIKHPTKRINLKMRRFIQAMQAACQQHR